MLELVVAPLVAVFLAATGYAVQSASRLEKRLDTIQIDLAKNYVTREELDRKFDGLVYSLQRMEEKLDAHVSEDQYRIAKLKRKYYD